MKDARKTNSLFLFTICDQKTILTVGIYSIPRFLLTQYTATRELAARALSFDIRITRFAKKWFNLIGRARALFAAWFTLQHLRGYKPFMLHRVSEFAIRISLQLAFIMCFGHWAGVFGEKHQQWEGM